MCGETENVHNGNFLKLHPFRLAVNGRQVVEGGAMAFRESILDERETADSGSL